MTVDWALIAPVAAAMTAGGLIGIERTYHGHPAGFRTHILVCMTSCVLMLAAMHQATWAFVALPDQRLVIDPTRMSHGILTGIGFLCAGVIFRTGFSIHGLTTAASLWMTSAIGLLFGAGLYALGATATVVTALILIGLKLVSGRLPARTVVDAEVCWDRRETSPEPAVEAALRAVDAAVRHDVFELIDEGRTVRRTWRLQAAEESELKRLAEQLCAIPGVTTYKLDPRAD